MRNLRFFVVFFTINFASAQTPNDFAESFFYFPKNISVLIPSYACMDSRLQANLAYKSYTGQLAALRTYYADINLDVRKEEKRSEESDKHVVGGGFYNEREGDFFNRSRILLRYGWHKKISEAYTISAGAALHGINYHFKTSSAGVSGSDVSWSGNFSTAFYSATFRAAVSFNEFNNPVIKPVNYTFILNRYFTLHAEKIFNLGDHGDLRGSARVNLVPNSISTSILQAGYFFSHRIGLNTFFIPEYAWGWAIDIDKTEFNNNRIDLSFAYRFPLSNRYPPNNLYEINISYFISGSQ